MKLLRKNPITMRGTLARCWLFTYGTPVSEARRLLPDQLEPVVHGDRTFWNVVVCEIRGMRPKPLPPFTGVSYRHVGYRLYARFHPAHGRAIEGLYFVRSDCDSAPMSVAGNVVTDFNFHTAPVRIREEEDGAAEINVDSPDAPARARLLRREAPELPAHSAFGSLEEAKAFLKYEPYGLSPADKGGANVVHVTRDEEKWRSRLVRVGEESWSFFEGREVLPEVCYEVEPIEYQWDRARIYRPFGA